MQRRLISNLLGLVGAIIGGVLGFYIFSWLEDKGFYGMVVPGAFVGLGCSLLAQHHSVPRGILCALGALGLSLFTECYFHPFNGHESFSFLITHVTAIDSVHLLMMAGGTIIAYWIGKDSGYRLLPQHQIPAPAETKKDSVQKK